MTSSYGIVAGLGALAGLRSTAAPTAVLLASRYHGFRLAGTPLDRLDSAAGTNGALAAVAGELVADKLPMTPARTSAFPLAARIASGAVAGASVMISRKTTWREGAVIGALAALASSFGAYYLRKSAGEATGIPDPVIALVEDAVVIAGGLAIAAALE